MGLRVRSTGDPCASGFFNDVVECDPWFEGST
jgi:hypothetical protein